MLAWISSLLRFFDPDATRTFAEGSLWYTFAGIFLFEVIFTFTIAQGDVQCAPVSEDNIDEFILNYSSSNRTTSELANYTFLGTTADFSVNKNFVNSNCAKEVKSYASTFIWLMIVLCICTLILMNYFSFYVYAIIAKADEVEDINMDENPDDFERKVVSLIKQIDRYLTFKIAVFFVYGTACGLFYLIVYIKYRVRGRAVTGAYFYNFICGVDTKYLWQQEDTAAVYRCVFASILALNFLDWVVMLGRILGILMIALSYYWLWDYKNRSPWDEKKDHDGVSFLPLLAAARFKRRLSRGEDDEEAKSTEVVHADMQTSQPKMRKTPSAQLLVSLLKGMNTSGKGEPPTPKEQMLARKVSEELAASRLEHSGRIVEGAFDVPGEVPCGVFCRALAVALDSLADSLDEDEAALVRKQAAWLDQRADAGDDLETLKKEGGVRLIRGLETVVYDFLEESLENIDDDGGDEGGMDDSRYSEGTDAVDTKLRKRRDRRNDDDLDARSSTYASNSG